MSWPGALGGRSVAAEGEAVCPGWLVEVKMLDVYQSRNVFRQDQRAECSTVGLLTVQIQFLMAQRSLARTIWVQFSAVHFSGQRVGKVNLRKGPDPESMFSTDAS